VPFVLIVGFFCNAIYIFITID